MPVEMLFSSKPAGYGERELSGHDTNELVTCRRCQERCPCCTWQCIYTPNEEGKEEEEECSIGDLFPLFSFTFDWKENQEKASRSLLASVQKTKETHLKDTRNAVVHQSATIKRHWTESLSIIVISIIDGQIHWASDVGNNQFPNNPFRPCPIRQGAGTKGIYLRSYLVYFFFTKFNLQSVSISM